ncbi:MAG: ribosomal L7Ae/L30e/S12e/Gadd45 family protein [Eubacteriales bacterium]|nr:ribosomal L7Ae/L30e/S12e/Gadd45 family protein [Eubacteriales bacterium]MDD4323365.1 ribosomal L7Ae/L30e/S12e/Gadd45 family protein [Eubacteriales bacterium]MDD4541218.1 ribosomal L7Ae/L30e/S12e/Gadd45 family protein [Eubacteriales bacterium]
MNYYLRMLGLARRANEVILGIDRIEIALKKNFRGTVFLANDLGASSRKKIKSLSERSDKVYLRELPHSREELGATQGMNSCAAIAVKEGTLEHTIRDAVDKAVSHEGGG